MRRERRVLLIEDDAILADLYIRQLRRDGIPLEHVSTGEDADAFVRDRVPALVLADLTLRDTDLQSLIESWAHDPVCAAIPVWILGNTMPDDTTWWHSAPNVQRYFPKARVVFSRLSREIRATLGLPYGERIGQRIAG